MGYGVDGNGWEWLQIASREQKYPLRSKLVGFQGVSLFWDRKPVPYEQKLLSVSNLRSIDASSPVLSYKNGTPPLSQNPETVKLR